MVASASSAAAALSAAASVSAAAAAASVSVSLSLPSLSSAKRMAEGEGGNELEDARRQKKSTIANAATYLRRLRFIARRYNRPRGLT